MSDEVRVSNITIVGVDKYSRTLELTLEKAKELQAILNDLFGNPFYPVPSEVPVYPAYPITYQSPSVAIPDTELEAAVKAEYSEEAND
ncbi:MAG: hypothetical protein KKD44_28315 [Proteobacteria bacterium]|nr:hypothetical protein [Pseudomonadota bacterium]